VIQRTANRARRQTDDKTISSLSILLLDQQERWQRGGVRRRKLTYRTSGPWETRSRPADADLP